jgi:hypothetical protein
MYLSLTLTLNHNLTSNDVPLEGLCHCLVVATSNLAHEVFVEIVSHFFDRVNSSHKLVLFLPGDVENAVKEFFLHCPLIRFQTSLNGVELTALRRKKLVHEPFGIKLVFDNLAVVDTEVVHDHDPLLKGVDPL